MARWSLVGQTRPTRPPYWASWVAQCGARDPLSLIHWEKCNPPSARAADAMCMGQEKGPQCTPGQNASYGLPTGSVNNPLGAKAAAKWTETKKGNFRVGNMQANLSFWDDGNGQCLITFLQGKAACIAERLPCHHIWPANSKWLAQIFSPSVYWLRRSSYSHSAPVILIRHFFRFWAFMPKNIDFIFDWQLH